jgi:hypothetical protein
VADLVLSSSARALLELLAIELAEELDETSLVSQDTQATDSIAAAQTRVPDLSTNTDVAGKTEGDFRR